MKDSMESEFPSNSHTRKPRAKQDAPEKKVEKVVKGGASTRKKSLSKRFAETFVGGDVKDVIPYVVFDVLIPAARDMLFDATYEGMQRTFYGEVRSPRRGPGSRAGHTPYHTMSSRHPAMPADPRGVPSRRSRAVHDFDEVVFDSRVEADEVLDRLFELVETYEMATVSDLYTMADIPASYTDEKYGWTDLHGADVTRIRGGKYLINLPRPVILD